MIPKKITKILTELKDMTENGELEWAYIDDDAAANADLEKFSIRIGYNFDINEGVGEFSVNMFDKEKSKDYFFYTNQNHGDYNLVRHLFDLAQSSDFDPGPDFRL